MTSFADAGPALGATPARSFGKTTKRRPRPMSKTVMLRRILDTLDITADDLLALLLAGKPKRRKKYKGPWAGVSRQRKSGKYVARHRSTYLGLFRTRKEAREAVEMAKRQDGK